jgi:membrane protease YdiL (CAAX protease family)
MIKNIISSSETNHNKIVFFKRMDGKRSHLTIKSSLLKKTDNQHNAIKNYAEAINFVPGIKNLKELESELHAEKKLRNQFGQFYIITIIIFFIISCIPNTSTYSPGNQLAWTWGGLILLLFPIICFVKKLEMSPADFGLTINNLKQNISEGLMFSFFLCSILFFYRYHTLSVGEPLICWKSFLAFSRLQFYIHISTYLIHCYLQEFIVRGVLQGLIQKFFKDSHFFFPVFLISFLFCAAHIRISFYFAALTFIVSIIFGCIYYRHKNLIGVSIVHYITGILAMAFGYF